MGHGSISPDLALNKKLFEIFKLALRNENVELRDAVVTYLAMAEIPGTASMVEEYVHDEKLSWLQAYALRVYEHLHRLEKGIPSVPPKRSTFAPANMGFDLPLEDPEAK